jgi:hypothetical protein
MLLASYSGFDVGRSGTAVLSTESAPITGALSFCLLVYSHWELAVIDLLALVGLFKDALGASKNWTEKNIAIIDINEADQEPAVQAVQAKGHEVQWLLVEKMHKLHRDGWSPVVERDKFLRPTVFMDRLKELMLFHRPKR